jgi:hypothetical protein
VRIDVSSALIAIVFACCNPSEMHTAKFPLFLAHPELCLSPPVKRTVLVRYEKTLMKGSRPTIHMKYSIEMKVVAWRNTFGYAKQYEGRHLIGGSLFTSPAKVKIFRNVRMSANLQKRPLERKLKIRLLPKPPARKTAQDGWKIIPCSPISGIAQLNAAAEQWNGANFNHRR